MATSELIDTGQLKLNIIAMVQNAAVEAGVGIGYEVQFIVARLANRIGASGDLARVHSQIAAEMRDRILDRFETNVEARKQHEDYGPRSGSPSRLSGGLRHALEQPSMVVGNAEGIVLGDSRLLQGSARHAFRLNFGTRGAGDPGSPAQDYPIMLFGERAFDVGLHEDPRPAIVMPPGLFLGDGGHTGGGKPVWYGASADRRGSDIFFPISGLQTRIKARAIEARRFLDAGLEALSEELSPAYNRLIDHWIADDRNIDYGEPGGGGGGTPPEPAPTPPQLQRLSVTLPTLRGGRVILETHQLL